MTQTLNVAKTIKLFIGGEFPRTESGRSYPLYSFDQKTEFARLCQASRKDLRNAVEAGHKALPGWSKRTSYNKGQIIYRMAEMMQGRKFEFSTLFQQTLGLSNAKAEMEVQNGIDVLVEMAGWADKYSQLLCSVNNVNASYHNFTTPSHIGVTAYLENDEFDFPHLLKVMAALILTGNTTIILLGRGCPAVLAPLAEVLATSDLPPGVVNFLTGDISELSNHFGGHYEIAALFSDLNNDELRGKMNLLAVENLKRIGQPNKAKNSLALINQFVEMQTIWHPIGI